MRDFSLDLFKKIIIDAGLRSGQYDADDFAKFEWKGQSNGGHLHENL